MQGFEEHGEKGLQRLYDARPHTRTSIVSLTHTDTQAHTYTFYTFTRARHHRPRLLQEQAQTLLMSLQKLGAVVDQAIALIDTALSLGPSPAVAAMVAAVKQQAASAHCG